MKPAFQGGFLRFWASRFSQKIADMRGANHVRASGHAAEILLILSRVLVVFRRNYGRACGFIVPRGRVNLETRLHVGRRKIVALEKQGRLHRLGEGIDSAVAKIEARLRIDALAVTAKSLKRQRGKMHVMRDDLRLNEREKILEVVQSVDAMSGEKDVTGFLIGDGANKAAIGGNDGLKKGCAFWFVIEDRNQGRRVDNDHRGKPKSS